MAYRTSQYRATACSPVLLMYGWELRTLCGTVPEHPDRPPREGYAHHLEEGMGGVHAFVRRQLHLVGIKMKRRYDHRSQASVYSSGMKIWLFNPWRTIPKFPKLNSPWKGPGVVLSQICDVVIVMC